MGKEYIVKACTGIKIEVRKGQLITVVDVEGGQVADFFAAVSGSKNEFLSTGATIDCLESLKLKEGDTVYSNLYNPILEIVYDDVKEHDLLHPCCRKEMYDFFYGNGAGHPNCLDNINGALHKDYALITPLNLFMHTKIGADGGISVEKPLSKSGDKIIMKALTDLTLGVAACSVSESSCNGGRCTDIKIIID